VSWQKKELGSIANFINGFAFKPAHWSSKGKPIIRIQNLTDSRKPFNYSTIDVAEKYHVTKGDLLVSWSATLDVFEWDKEDALLNQHIFKVVPDYARVDKNYLRFALRGAIESMMKFTRGSTMKHVNRGDFLGTNIPLPPLPVQKQIAAVLEKADTLRSQCQQMEQELNSLAQSVFLDMFGDPATNPKSWPIAPVKEFLKVTTGNTPPKAVNEYYSDNHIEWAKSDNINTPSDYLTQASTYLSEKGKAVGRTVPSGSILVTCIAGSPSCIGNAAITDREVAFNQQINAVTPIETKCISEFVYMSFIVGKSLIQRASTNSMKGMVSKGNFEKIEFPLPPIDLQKQYCDIFQTILRSRQDANMNYRSNVDLFNSLIQRAFKGELDLKDVA
jgi:type I restriction enzyme S subunit